MLGSASVTDEIIEKILYNSVGIEIGVWKGGSSKKFIKKTKHLYLIDPWNIQSYTFKNEKEFNNFIMKYSSMVGSKHIEDFQKFYDLTYQNVCKKFMDKPVSIYRMKSDHFFEIFNKKVDWVYIDGDHSYQGCLNDLENSSKITNLIFGDDYNVKYGVTKAVDNFIQNNNCIIQHLNHNQYEIRILND